MKWVQWRENFVQLEDDYREKERRQAPEPLQQVYKVQNRIKSWNLLYASHLMGDPPPRCMRSNAFTAPTKKQLDLASSFTQLFNGKYHFSPFLIL
jgi:hypothetical protein